MQNINSLIIEGNMVKDPVTKETSKGTKLCTFSIAANRSIKNSNGEYSKEVSYFEIETWGKLAQICTTIGGKGKPVRIVGRLKQNRWDGADGKHYSKIYIVAEHVEFKPSYNKNCENSEKTNLQNQENEDELIMENSEIPVFEACPEPEPVF
ncbi:MAG: single-stranded DNA-binding protein [Treponemataceae bacterium]